MTLSSVIELDDHVKVTKDRNDVEDCIEFGKRLGAAMDAMNISQAELSRLMEVSRSAVNWWVQGKTYPSIENAKRLGALLRVSPEYLLFNVVLTKSDRLMTSVPVYHKHGGIDLLSLPNEFVAREFPKAGDLRAAAIYTNGQPGMIAIADGKDTDLTDEPRCMLIDFGNEYSPAMVSKDKAKVLIDDLRHNTQHKVRPGSFTILGHMIAELNVTGGC